MKINLQTRLFPQYNPMVSLSENKAKKEAEKEKQAEEEAKKELIENLGKIKTFTLGTTPNFTIDLNPDMLTLDDIDQLIVSFGQFGKLVQREILYFSDNYKLDYEVDSEGNYIPLTAEVKTDEQDIFSDEIKFLPVRDINGDFVYDSEGEKIYKWMHVPQTIRNPKFTYNRIYNKLTLTLSQLDTLTHFKPTDWKWHDDKDPEPELPYWENNPSLVMIEVKIKTKNRMDIHSMGQVIIRPQEYYAVADTIEHTLERPERPVIHDVHKTAADMIYTPHRFRIYYDDFFKPSRVQDLPMRVEELTKSKQTTEANLCRDGLYVKSYPQYELDSEGKIIMDYTFDSEGIPVEKNRYFCVMIPLFAKIKIKSVKLLFGGSPGVMDHVDFDSEGRVIPTRIRYPEHLYTSEGFPLYNENGEPQFNDPKLCKHETVYYSSAYVIDPDGGSPENPMGEYICWYICAKEASTGVISRFYGPAKYRKDQRQKPCYNFLIQFEDVNRASFH